MIPVDNGIRSPQSEIEESNGRQVKEFSSVDISNSTDTLPSNENPHTKLKHLANEKDLISRFVPSPHSNGLKSRFHRMFAQKLEWNSVKKMCVEWIKNPMNMALFAWIVCVAVSGAIMFFVMTGMLNNVLKTKSERNTWFEINNQILNALFTLMCLYQHPKRFHHLVLLCRWRTNDISTLRMIYCKNGTSKPHEWRHMMVVVILLHVNCFAQYALCGLNLGYTRSQRPAVGVGITISVAIATPAIAGFYIILSPLGKDYDCEKDEESQDQITKPFEKKYAFASKDQQGEVIELENRPNWSGGILEIWHDISVSFLSLFCIFCVFGWNLERLGFGNMYVHIATFMLLCMAPFWVFVLASGNIDDDNVRMALIAIGIILCFCGLLYGGFWRIQMRKRFNFPAYDFCFGKPSVSDCTLWLCCCWCSLAQETRTGNSYDILEDKLCLKEIDTCDQVSTSNLDREDVVVSTKSDTSFTLESGKDVTMTPPSPSLIQKEDH
ncbi:unnamed protein product [Vicia faba]|uniref:PLAC8 family protein n=1 Tax=Vicia faba TaxID=3906 RepID=A0AAV0ZZM7_VICFA|nr:unnamed protein product [Vicia faba]